MEIPSFFPDMSSPSPGCQTKVGSGGRHNTACQWLLGSMCRVGAITLSPQEGSAGELWWRRRRAIVLVIRAVVITVLSLWLTRPGARVPLSPPALTSVSLPRLGRTQAPGSRDVTMGWAGRTLDPTFHFIFSLGLRTPGGHGGGALRTVLGFPCTFWAWGWGPGALTEARALVCQERR